MEPAADKSIDPEKLPASQKGVEVVGGAAAAAGLSSQRE